MTVAFNLLMVVTLFRSCSRPRRPDMQRHAMNALVNDFQNRRDTIAAWRHHLHKHPERSLEEAETAKYIAGLVRSWGYDVVEGVGQYGVVASLTAGRRDAALSRWGDDGRGRQLGD
jgi:hypothetical protein